MGRGEGTSSRQAVIAFGVEHGLPLPLDDPECRVFQEELKPNCDRADV